MPPPIAPMPPVAPPPVTQMNTVTPPAAPVTPPPNVVRGMSDATFTTVVAVIITAISILIAVGAWRTTEAASRASDLDSLVIQQLARRQQEMQALNGLVDLDLRLLARFQGYVLAATRLDAAALTAGEPGAIDRQLLEVQAQGQRALSRVMNQFFQASFPTVDADGIAAYDPDKVLANLEAGSYRLADLQPEDTARRADQAHHQTAAFVLIVIVFTACLVLLTLAQVTRRRLRMPLAVAGSLLAMGGLALLVMVETVLYRAA
jgi:hypothetical protein